MNTKLLDYSRINLQQQSLINYYSITTGSHSGIGHWIDYICTLDKDCYRVQETETGLPGHERYSCTFY